MIFNLSETNTGGGSPVINPLSVIANGTYTAPSGVDGYSPVSVNVPQGLIIPDGYAYFNGYLLPELPTYSDYAYAFIRKNDQNDTFDCVLGHAQWYSSSNATLDNWRLTFTGQANYPAQQYAIPQDGTATDWGEPTPSTNVYGTNSARKVIWTSHDILITNGANILLREGFAIDSGGVIV